MRKPGTQEYTLHCHSSHSRLTWCALPQQDIAHDIQAERGALVDAGDARGPSGGRARPRVLAPLPQSTIVAPFSLRSIGTPAASSTGFADSLLQADPRDCRLAYPAFASRACCTTPLATACHIR